MSDGVNKTIKEYKYIIIRESKDFPNYKRKAYDIINKKHGFKLGVITYNPAWWQYIFAPEKATIFSVGCMKDIMNFIDEL